jgi:hypothetical protein
VLGDVIGAWPSVVLIALSVGAIVFVVADRDRPLVTAAP